MSTLEHLRPIEVLFINDYSKDRKSNIENYVRAVLTHLCIEGYVSYEESLLLGRKDINDLREYELEIIRRLNENNWLNFIFNYDFKKELVPQGLFRVEIRKKGWWIFKYSKKIYSTTEKFDNVIKKVNILEAKINSCINERKTPDKFIIAMAYAFPHLASSKQFSDYCQEFSEKVEAAKISSRLLHSLSIIKVPYYDYRPPFEYMTMRDINIIRFW